MNIFKKLLIITIVLASQMINAQSVNLNDLQNIQVDNLSDEQITNIVKNAQDKGLTPAQIETMALSRGMSKNQIDKLKERIEKLNNKEETSTTDKKDIREYDFKIKEEDIFSEVLKKETDQDSIINAVMKKIFGFSLFNNKTLSFEPSINIPTPENYQLGPGDQILINVWGASQQNYDLVISPEGNVIINDVGPVNLNGLTMEKASNKIKQRLTSIYSGLAGNNPNTFAQVSIGNIRSIKVNVTGEAIMPGTYTLPSLATVFNALYYAGGPGINGSFRNIKVIREGKETASVDLYEFLMSGKCESNIVLKDQDIIFIPPYITRIEIEGEVKREGIYELTVNENLNDLINYAGGFTKDAYTRNIVVERNTNKEKELANVGYEEWNGFKMRNGDKIKVGPVIERYANRVEIKGAVFREGVYELTGGLTLKQLIDKAEGLREDAFLSRAVIYRLNLVNKTEILSVDLNAIAANAADDIKLQREDIITIYSVFDLEEEYNVSIEGEVQFPGQFKYYENIKLGELVATAGGFKEAASLARIDVARRIKNKTALMPESKVAEVFSFPVSDELLLSDQASQFVLEPYDVVFVRKSPGYEEQQFVYVTGEVAFPGKYSISNKNQKISDFVGEAGGLTNEAYVKGTRLIRRMPVEKIRQKALEAIERESEDTASALSFIETEQAIGIDLEKILQNPGSKFDILLQEGDRLEVPKQLQTVRMSGALLYPVSTRYDKNKSVRSYVSTAGGFTQDAKVKKTYVLYANGSVKRTKSFLGLKNYPKIEPGAEIIVPSKPEKEKMSVQEAVSLGSMVTSMSLVIITIITNLSNSKTN